MAEFTGPDLHKDRQGQLDGGSTDRIVEKIVDRCLPFQLSGLVPLHDPDPRRMSPPVMLGHAARPPMTAFRVPDPDPE